MTATLVANNDTGSQARVNCSLLLGAVEIDETSADATGIELGANVQVGSREAIGLTGGGELAAPGDAAVECETNASSGNSTGFSITAIKVSSLTMP